MVTTVRANPYVGPRAFRENERLYGRDRETLDLLDLVLAERLVLLLSPSGAGKTSLINAALLPKLRDEGFRVSPVIRVNAEPPAATNGREDRPNRYVLSVLHALEEQRAPEGDRLPVAELAGLTLAEYLDEHPVGGGREGPEILIFDQFEEVLTVDPTDVEAKEEFFEQLGEALSNRRRWALFAMREDYWARLDPYLCLVPTQLSTTYRLDLLTPEAASTAIQRPAEGAGVEFP